MVPTNERSSRRGNNRSGAGSGRVYRDANTSAGINRLHSSTVRNARRARGRYFRRSTSDLNQPPVNAPTGPSLAGRITFADSRDHGSNGRGGNMGLNCGQHSHMSRPRPQMGRKLQDHTTRVDGTSGGESSLTQQHLAPTVNNDPDSDEIDASIFQSTDTQASTLFCGLQPTQPTNPASNLPARSAAPPRLISMVNQPVVSAIPKRLYDGSDLVKRAVSNPKLRAILSGKPLPKERRKYVGERMELRLGGGRVMK